jgi:hypothetical protein
VAFFVTADRLLRSVEITTGRTAPDLAGLVWLGLAVVRVNIDQLLPDPRAFAASLQDL